MRKEGDANATQRARIEFPQGLTVRSLEICYRQCTSPILIKTQDITLTYEHPDDNTSCVPMAL
jgi:hypothetical protein